MRLKHQKIDRQMEEHDSLVSHSTQRTTTLGRHTALCAAVASVSFTSQ
jgi:hypothetical protein